MIAVKRFRQMPIAYQLWILAAFVLVILSGSLSVAYYTITGTLVQNNISYTNDVFSQVKASLEKQCERLESLLQKTGYNRAVFKYLAADSNNERYQPYLEMNTLAVNANQLEPSVQEFVLRGYNGVVYYSNGKTKEVEQALDQVPKEANNYYQLTNLFQYKKLTTKCFVLTTQLRDIYNITQVPDSGQISFVIRIDFLGITDFKDQFLTGIYVLDANHAICAQNRIPKMVLQPLIENAITHGLEDRARGGLLKIGGSFDSDGMTLLWVEDNGTGMNEEQLSRLRSVIAKEETFRSESIGFENVVYRVKLLYGKRCRITVESAPSRGTRIELRIPWTE